VKILEFHLAAFGPFTDLALNLAEGREGMHLLYGPNEAGKSSALRALKYLLFGIEKNSRDNFLHDNKALRIGGILQNVDGAKIAFLRRKGNKDTLLTPEGKPLPDQTMERFLHGVTEEAFGLLFGIDHEALVRGGQNILEGKGEAGQTLFAAGAGGANLRAILETIEAKAENLFKNRGQNPVINKQIRSHQELKKRISELAQSSREWAEKDKALGRSLAEAETLKKTLEQHTAEVNRLRRLKAIIPKEALRKDLLARVEAMGAVVVLPEDFSEKRRHAQNRLHAAFKVRHQAEFDLKRLNAEIAQIAFPRKLLDQADGVEGLHKRLGQHAKAAADLGTLQGRLQQNKADIRTLLLELKPSLNMETVRNFRPQAAVKARIQKLASRHESLQAELSRTEKDLRNAEEKYTRLKEELKALKAPKDTGPLRKTLSGLAKSGDLASAFKDAENTLHEEEEKIRTLLQRLPLWRRPVEDLAQAPVPLPETVGRFEETFSRDRSIADDLNRRLNETRNASREIRRQIDAIHLSGAVPTESALESARKRRREGWALVKRAWLEKEDVAAESRLFDSEHGLPEAYEISVSDADETADRLRREAARVAEYAALLVQEKKLQEETAGLEKDWAEAEAFLARNGAEWKALWAPAGIEPLSPREMRSWLEQYQKILQRLEQLAAQKILVGKIEERIAGHREALIRHLEELGEDHAAPRETLGQLVERSESVLERLETFGRRYGELEQQAADLSEAIRTLAQTKTGCAETRNAWKAEWSQAVKTIGLDAETTPGEALVTLSKFEDLFKKIDECDGLDQRIFGIRRDAEAFHNDVKALIGHVAPEWSDLSSDQAVAQLNAELNRARDAAARHAQLAKEISEKRGQLAQAEKEMALERETLDSLCRQAGCSAHEELDAREKASADYQDMMGRIRVLETEIVEAGGGAGLDAILRQIAQADVDALSAHMEDLESRLAESKERKAEMHETIGSLRSELGRMNGSAAAAEAAEEAQEVLAEIRDNVDAYVKLRLSSLLLRRAVEQYRAKHQGPLLDRAGDLFARLTLGSFSGLRTDYAENDMPILQGVRPGGRAVDVTGMSDGTRDQLFLSFRLATLEQYLEGNEPMPFIVDDILIRFDDDRSKTTLEVLADLSQKTQVLFFTHHERLVEIAQSLQSEAGLFVHRMG